MSCYYVSIINFIYSCIVIYGLFDCGVSSLVHVVSNNRMISEKWIGKDVEEKDPALIWSNIQALSSSDYTAMNCRMTTE
jgi:hypothetical protein